jgi:oligoendopeptidase F
MKAKAAYLQRKTGEDYSKGLPFYEMFAPVGDSSDKDFNYDKAKEFVTDNFARFSAGMADVARKAFENNWIDVYPRDGKVSGAFCGDIYAIKQFRILLNYGNSLSDAITLAHELGHGYHSMQIMHEGVLNTNYPMPLAETASTFCETIVTNAALAEMNDADKLQLLENSLQDATQVLLDIYSRFLFEQAVFKAREDHPLSTEELKGFMLDAQRAAYGDGLDPNALHPYMWLIKPHYYSAGTSYYNFPYAFGHLMANGLYRIYEADPAAFGEKYDAFLRASGKMSMKDSAAMLGVDIEDVTFWDGAIQVILKNIDEFKRISA